MTTITNIAYSIELSINQTEFKNICFPRQSKPLSILLKETYLNLDKLCIKTCGFVVLLKIYMAHISPDIPQIPVGKVTQIYHQLD